MKLIWPMSMRNRIARHGQAAIRANLSSTPREPLLFLYPTFARKQSTAQSPIELSNPIQPPLTTLPSPDNTTHHSHLKSASTPAYLSPEAELDGRALPPRRSDAKRSGQVPMPPPQHKGTVKDKPEEDLFISPAERKMHRIWWKAHQAKEEEQRKRALRREWQTQRDERLLRQGDPDWRAILQLLKESTPQHGKYLAEAITVTVSTESMQKLLLGLDEDMWSIANAYDCSIGFGGIQDSLATHHTFVLSGSAVSISKTIAHLLRIAPGMQIDSSAIGGQEKDGGRHHSKSDGFVDQERLPDHLRYVVPTLRRTTLKLREDGLPYQPVKWSKDVFFKYVFDLIRSRQHIHRPGLSNHRGRSHTSVVIGNLHELFTNRKYKPYVTSKAIKEAINYFLNHSCIHEARSIFNIHAIKDSELFNMMLEKTGTVNDLHNFQFILNLMLRKGFLPNRATWDAFLNANKGNLQIQLAILSAMKGRGLLQNVLASEKACQVFALSNLEMSLSNQETQEEYMQQMDIRYGPEWLSSNTANRILQILASRGLISRSVEFLQIMDSRFVKPQSIAVNTILQHCNTSRNLGGALELMKFVRQFQDFVPDEDTYRLLMAMAWQSKNFNLSRVVWKYACLSGKVSYRTRSYINSSIGKNMSGNARASSRRRFLSLAARFILGQDISPNDVESSRDDDKTILVETLRKDMDNYGKWETPRPLEEMLQEALDLDTAWKIAQAEKGVKYELKWMLENGIDVPIRPFRGVRRKVICTLPRTGIARKYYV